MAKTVKQVRKELRAWGNYWRWQEMGQGYSKRSACDKLGEVLTNSDAHLYENEFDAPEHVLMVNAQVQRLSNDCRRALRAKYVCFGMWALCNFKAKATYDYWLKKAEVELI